MEAFLDGEWDSLSKLFSCEDSDFLLHCNTSNLMSNNGEILSHASENVGADMLLPSYNLDSFYSVSQESSHNSSDQIESSLFAFLGDEDRPVAAHAGGFNNTYDQSMLTDDLMEEILQLKASILCNDQLQNEGTLIRPNESDVSCKKRPGQASKRNAETKRAKRGAKTSNNVEEEVKINNGSSSSCCSEGDDCNASEEMNGGSTSESTKMTKKKASKNPATDPQSLYARKRRERINERLRILQNLVPNGTKVDISTMLEEAVDYVKFLQLQIKLLSSDDMWMYAPIAYNGMDMGLYQRIIPKNL